MTIDSCFCRGLRFDELYALAGREGLDARELRDRTGCGTACGLCVPYIVVMLKKGRTDLPLMDEKEFLRILDGECEEAASGR